MSHRGLCRPCSAATGQNGTLKQWEPVFDRARTLAEFAAEFAILDKAGVAYMDICRKLGYSTANDGAVLRVMIIRAQKKNLLPAGRPRCGWRPPAPAIR